MNTEKRHEKVSRRRAKQIRYLSQAIQLEEAVNPHIIRSTMGMVSLAVLVFIAWAGFTNIHEVARTPGEVVPQGHQQTVQHLEGGAVHSILVREGEIVEQGQVLLVMDESGLRQDLERARSRQTALDLQEERLRAFTEGRSADFSKETLDKDALEDQEKFLSAMRRAREAERQVIEEQVAQRQRTIRTLQSDLATARNALGIAQDLYNRRAELNRRGFFSDVQLLESRQQVNDLRGDIRHIEGQIGVTRSEIAEYRGRLESLSARHMDDASERLDQLIAEQAQNREVIRKLEGRIARLEVRAPTRGMVKGLAVNTVGAVVRPGETLMEIVPLDRPLEVQVRISPKDIGHLKTGQAVQVKFSTFDFSRYGSVTGRLDRISATTFAGADGARYYEGRVLLEKNYVGDNPANAVLPGMTVMADIITGDKTILQYLLKPIHLSLRTAFRER